MLDKNKTLYIISTPEISVEKFKKKYPECKYVQYFMTPRYINIRSDVRAMVRTAITLGIENVHFVVCKSVYDYERFIVELEFELDYIANVMNLDVNLSLETDEYNVL